jgi:hypothetical protein
LEIPNGQDREVSKSQDPRIESIFTFNDLQNIHQLAEKVATASMIIDQNKRILEYLRKRYNTLAGSKVLGLFANMASFEPIIFDFLQHIGMLEGDLDGQLCRIKTLLRSLETTEELVCCHTSHSGSGLRSVTDREISSKASSNTEICDLVSTLPRSRKPRRAQ